MTIFFKDCQHSLNPYSLKSKVLSSPTLDNKSLKALKNSLYS